MDVNSDSASQNCEPDTEVIPSVNGLVLLLGTLLDGI